jgi:hypothetical protein
MKYNRLFVKPTQVTLDYLSALLSGSPIDLDLTEFKVEIITTQDALEIDPTRVYTGRAINVNVFYDTHLQRSNLICTLVSEDLQARAKELADEGVERALYDWYVPYLVIKRGMPPLSKHYRSWKVGLANALCQNERPLSFTSEYVEVEDLTGYPDYDYIVAMSNELQTRYGV